MSRVLRSGRRHPATEDPLELQRDSDRDVVPVEAGGDLHPQAAGRVSSSPSGTWVTGTPARLKTAAGVSSHGRPTVLPWLRCGARMSRVEQHAVADRLDQLRRQAPGRRR